MFLHSWSLFGSLPSSHPTHPLKQLWHLASSYITWTLPPYFKFLMAGFVLSPLLILPSAISLHIRRMLLKGVCNTWSFNTSLVDGKGWNLVKCILSNPSVHHLMKRTKCGYSCNVVIFNQKGTEYWSMLHHGWTPRT